MMLRQKIVGYPNCWQRFCLSTIKSFTNDSRSSDYQYLQKGEIPMLHFQRSLPRLPIPRLEKTCERYLAACQPILTGAEFESTKKCVNEFQQNSGADLQSRLMKLDSENRHTSYISRPWFDMYLSDRQPLPINYNPILIMKSCGDRQPSTPPTMGNRRQMVRTANIIISSLRFMRSLYSRQLDPEVYHMNGRRSNTPRFRFITRMTPELLSTYVAYTFKAFPLDMSQYTGLFGATRIPKLDKDWIYRNPNENQGIRHVMVMRHGQFFKLNVLTENGLIVEPNVILERLSVIMNNQLVGGDPMTTRQPPIGILTTQNRNDWARSRAHLEQNGNRDQLLAIDSALFMINLDDDTIDGIDEGNPLPMVKNMLCENGENRWFDKSISIIVAKDGTACINFEHSWGDGVAVLRYFNEIYNEITNKPFIIDDDHHQLRGSSTKQRYGNTRDDDDDDDDAAAASNIELIKFNLDETIKNDILRAIEKHKKVCESLALHSMIYPELNKRKCKEFGVSPDAIMQLGFQLAYFKQTGRFVGTYESCSTAAFRHGRTETLRPCTMATKAFCERIEIVGKKSSSSSSSSVELRELIQKCSTVHGQLTKEAAMGQGFDRHLFGLRCMAELNGLPKPSLYEHISYERINHNILSTSTLSSPALLAGGFGPVCANGYGIGYNIQDEQLGAIVSSYAAQTNGQEFIDCLLEAYKDIKYVLDKTAD